MLANILLYAGLFLAGGIAALKIVAPRTKTQVDDKVLLYAEDVEKVLEGLGAAKNPGVEVVPTQTAAK